MEHLRHWATWLTWALVIWTLYVFGWGAFFLAAWLLGFLFLFGFELSRPVARSPMVDNAWTLAVRGLLLAFVPIIFVVFVADMYAEPVYGGEAMETPWHFVLLRQSFWLTALGATFGSFHIVRIRGPPAAFRFHLQTLWALLPSALFAVILPSGGLWLVAPTLFFAPAVIVCAHALWRIPKPAPRPIAPIDPPMAPVQPTFSPFRG